MLDWVAAPRSATFSPRLKTCTSRSRSVRSRPGSTMRM
jgi:hypothetical protein